MTAPSINPAAPSETDTWQPADVHALCGHAFLTELGWMLAVWRGTTLRRLVFDQPTGASAWARLEGEATGEVVPTDPPPWILRLVTRLERFANGERIHFDDVPIAQDHLTAFQSSVVTACRQITWGTTRSYGQLAAAAGSPRAARAVGSVMANNRFPIIVPCHRVTAAGKLGGFSSTRGVDTKRRLLEMEGSFKPRRRPAAASR